MGQRIWRPETVIIGCGVSGLTCGIRLLESGFPVQIFARDLPPHTTSDTAAAVWYPYKAYPEERVLSWGRTSVDVFYNLMPVQESGIQTVILNEFFDQPVPDPWWKNAVRHFARHSADNLPPGYQDGYSVEAPLIETPVYMRYLQTRFHQLGGQIHQRTIAKLSELYDENRIIVNCSGVGARELADDSEVYPIRGQIIRAGKVPGIEQCFFDESGHLALTYIIPRSKDIILGGTAEENNFSLEVDPQISSQILQKCRQLAPAFETAEILEHLVGLRPGRKEVRLELEQISESCAIIHNYGHGGAGFTLSWGCAKEVVELAQNFISTTNR
jgi:D-amino-acid oxidase